MEYRHYYLARHFQRLGLTPVIVCASFHHLMTKTPERRFAEIDGIPYLWIKTRRYEGNHLGRVLNMVEFSWRLAFQSQKQLPKPDVVVASSPHPFVALNGRRLARKHNAKFIFEVRDLWPLTLLEVGGHSPRHPLVRAMARAERTGYECCDYTVSLLGGAKDYMVAHGLDEEKFVHIPNGFDLQIEREEHIAPLPEEHGRVMDDLKQRGQRIVLYSGNHGLVNALENVIEAAGLLEDEESLHFVLVGQGPEKERLQQAARQAQLQNVTFLPPVSRAQMPALTGAADVGYIGLQKKDLFKYGVSPNKLFEYMSAGLPVVFAIDTTFDEVAQAQCGFSVAADNPVALAAVLRRMALTPETQLKAMGRRGREHVTRDHTYEILAGHYARLF